MNGNLRYTLQDLRPDKREFAAFALFLKYVSRSELTNLADSLMDLFLLRVRTPLFDVSSIALAGDAS